VVKKANLSGGKGLTKQNASRQLTASAQDTTDEAKGPAVATGGKTDTTDTTGEKWNEATHRVCIRQQHLRSTGN